MRIWPSDRDATGVVGPVPPATPAVPTPSAVPAASAADFPLRPTVPAATPAPAAILRNRRLLVRGFFTGSPVRNSKEFEIFEAAIDPKIPFGCFHINGFVSYLRRAAGRLRTLETDDALAAPLHVAVNNLREKTAYEYILPR
jgi:hypothetical protein